MYLFNLVLKSRYDNSGWKFVHRPLGLKRVTTCFPIYIASFTMIELTT